MPKPGPHRPFGKCQARNHEGMPDHRIPRATVRGFLRFPWWKKGEFEEIEYCEECAVLMEKMKWFGRVA